MRGKNGHGNGYPGPACNEKERLCTPLTPAQDMLASHVEARGNNAQRVVIPGGKGVTVKAGGICSIWGAFGAWIGPRLLRCRLVEELRGSRAVLVRIRRSSRQVPD